MLYDTTDPLLVMPSAENLWQFMNADNSDTHLTFRYAMLSDVDMNVVQQLQRPAQQSGLFANAVNEKKRHKGFKGTFNALFEQNDSIGASHSAIFKPILEELNYLAKLPNTDVKHLIIYSNLVENSDWLSYYSGTDLWQLRYALKTIVKRYLAQVPKATNYKGVQLHIVFKPSDFEDNKRFKQLRAVYTEVFSQLNVQINFSANLTKAQEIL